MITSTGDDGDNPSADASRGDAVDRQRALWPANVDDDELGDAKALLGLLRPVAFDSGQLIFAEEDPGDNVYVIESGTAKIKRRGAGGRHNVIAIAGPGDIVGELSIFDPGPRTDTVVAASDLQAGYLDRGILRRFIAERPALLQELLQLLARQVKRRHDQLAAMVMTDVTGRVARQLLHLAMQFGTEQGSEMNVSVGLTDDEFADLVGTSGQTLSAILRDLEDRSWIRRESAAIAVVDRPALEQLANQLSADRDRPIDPYVT